MIRFCTTHFEMIEMIKELQRKHNSYYLFRNKTANLIHKGKYIKYVFYIEPKQERKKEIKRNTMLWWKDF